MICIAIANDFKGRKKVGIVASVNILADTLRTFVTRLRKSLNEDDADEMNIPPALSAQQILDMLLEKTGGGQEEDDHDDDGEFADDGPEQEQDEQGDQSDSGAMRNNNEVWCKMFKFN